MKQILQNMRDGKTSVVDLPVPSVKRKTALVQTCNSLVSTGSLRYFCCEQSEQAETDYANGFAELRLG